MYKTLVNSNVEEIAHQKQQKLGPTKRDIARITLCVSVLLNNITFCNFCCFSCASSSMLPLTSI